MTGIKAAKARLRAPLKRDLRAAIESRLRLGDTEIFRGFSWRQSLYSESAPWHLFELAKIGRSLCTQPYSLCKREMSHRVGPKDWRGRKATAGLLPELPRCHGCMNAFAGRA